MTGSTLPWANPPLTLNTVPGFLAGTFRNIIRWLKPRGCLAAFYSEFRFDPSSPVEILQADHTALDRAFTENQIPYRSRDFTESHYRLMARKHQAAAALEEDFIREGNLLLFVKISTESIPQDMPCEEFKKFSARYLYLASL